MRLALDWDGTITETDTLHMLLSAFGDAGIYGRTEATLALEQMTLQDVIATQLATLDIGLEEAVGWLVANVEVRPGFAELVADDNPVVVSAGFHELIEPILAREGISVEVRANRLRVDGRRWHCRFRSTEACGVCGEPCKRAVVADLVPYAYAGDGLSDRCVSLAAECRFARAGLARYLALEGVPYDPFDDLHVVHRALAKRRVPAEERP
jgi:2-hydroxy-3-keto-5-methylthiopentenyl-1-phosphate phosphatase